MCEVGSRRDGEGQGSPEREMGRYGHCLENDSNPVRLDWKGECDEADCEGCSRPCLHV